MKKLGIVIFILFILFVFMELICNHIFAIDIEHSGLGNKYFFLPYKKIEKFSPEKEFDFDKKTIYFTQKNNKKDAIAVVGCSCTYGLGLKEDETFAANLNKLTGRKIYSRAILGRGLADIYYQVDKKLIPEDIEYLLYVYLPLHQGFLYEDLGLDINDSNEYQYKKVLRYKILNNELKVIGTNIFDFLFSVRLFKKIFLYKSFKDGLKDYKLFSFMMLKTVERLKENYPNTKLIILKYQVFENQPAYLPEILENKLKNEGVIIIDSEKLTGEKYYSLDNKLEDEKIHPNARVWKKLTPELVKVLNL